MNYRPGHPPLLILFIAILLINLASTSDSADVFRWPKLCVNQTVSVENKSDKEIALMKDWAKVRIYMEENFEKKPDIQGFLFLIGVNEKGEVREYEKEEKQEERQEKIKENGECRWKQKEGKEEKIVKWK